MKGPYDISEHPSTEDSVRHTPQVHITYPEHAPLVQPSVPHLPFGTGTTRLAKTRDKDKAQVAAALWTCGILILVASFMANVHMVTKWNAERAYAEKEIGYLGELKTAAETDLKLVRDHKEISAYHESHSGLQVSERESLIEDRERMLESLRKSISNLEDKLVRAGLRPYTPPSE